MSITNNKIVNKILIGILIIISSNLFGQDCDCLKSISFLQEKVELNQASYQHQVVHYRRQVEYIVFKNKINELAKRIDNKRDCIGLIAVYLNFFRDEHSFISYNENYHDKDKLHKIIKVKEKSSNNFEGIWYFQDKSFSIEIIPFQTVFSQWSAIIRKNNTSQWKNKQVKIEFYKDEDEKLQCIYWRQNLVPKVYDVNVTDSILTIGRYLNFYKTKANADQIILSPKNELEFIELTASTNYIKLPSFDLSQTQKIDSLIFSNQKLITSKSNLIIDVRNNGGGGFDAFRSILPFILDSEIVEQPYYGSVWVSKDNLEYYDRTKFEYAKTKNDSIDELIYVQFLEKYKGAFTPIEMEKDSISLSKELPIKIGILFNRFTASSAEGFILASSYSNKVKTFGENTMGAVSYGDWMPLEIPELNIWVAITTKKMIFKKNEDFESIGILPNADLSFYKEENWIEIVLKELEKK